MESMNLLVWKEMADQVMLHYREKDVAYVLAERLRIVIDALRAEQNREIKRLQMDLDFHESANFDPVPR